MSATETEDVPALTVSNVTETSATLTIVNHSTAWWYEGNQAGATCTSVSAGTSTAELSDLTGGTSYTYKAYDKTGCHAADEIASETFTTISLTASNVRETRVILTLDHYHAESWYVKKIEPPESLCLWIQGHGVDMGGLYKGTDYTIGAYSTSGCTPASKIADVQFTTPGTRGPPGKAPKPAIRLPSLPDPAGGKLLLFWYDSINDNGGSRITGYDVRYGVKDSNNYSDVKLERFTFLVSVKLTGLTNDAEYEVMIRAINEKNGAGPWSDPATGTPSRRPDQPLTVANVTQTTATLSLANSTGDWWHERDSDPLTCTEEKSGTKTVDVSGLSPGTTYTFRAFNHWTCIDGLFEVAWVRFTTPTSAPPPPPPPSLVLLPSRVTVPESWTATYTVALDTLPTADVTVTVASNDTEAVTVEPGTLTFTPSNYRSAQTVTVTGVIDADDEDEHVTLSHEAEGGGYNAFEIVTVLVNDRTPLTFGDQTIPDQTYVHRTAIAALTLPPALGNNGRVRYAITPALPAGLTFDPTTRVLAGTPTEIQTATSYTYTATDVDGVTATATFTLTVETDVEPTFDDDPLIIGPLISDQTYVHQTAIEALTLSAATGGNGALTYAISPALPAGLTFDPATRVLAGTPTETQAATTYTYTATDVDGDAATVTFTLTVEADVEPTFDDPLVTGPLIPDQTYVHQTAITAWTLPAATGGNPPLTYTLAASAFATAETRSPAPAGSGAPAAQPAGLTFTPAAQPLTATPSVLESETADASATLPAGLTFDPETRVLVGTPMETQEAIRYIYTATDVDGDAVTVTFTILVEADVEPAFDAQAIATQAIADQTYLQQKAIRAVTLPVATSGNGLLRYDLKPDPPAGLTFDPGTRVLAGTPTEPQAATRYTYTATDGDGDPATVTFTITVYAAAEKALLKTGLAAQCRALLSGVTGVIGERFRSPSASSWAGTAAACTGAPPDPAGSTPQPEDCATGLLTTVAEAILGMSGGWAAGTDSLNLTDVDETRLRGPRMINGGTQPAWNWESLVWGRSFAVPLKKPGSPGSAGTLWGAGDIQGFQGTPGQGQYDGQVRSLYLGVDTQWHEHWLAGTALARSWGTTDYAAGAGGSAGQLETTLTSIYPYVRGTLGDGLEVWALGGYGRGEAELSRPDQARADASDLSLALGATGVRQPMTEFGGAQWTVVGGVGYLSLDTEGGDLLVSDLDVAVQRARLAVEATWAAGGLAPYVQVGGRYDGGAGQTGAGLETVAGLRYTSERLEFEARGRWLATHAAEGYEEYGGLARLAVKPLADGTGWQMDVAPRWGAAQGAGLLGGGAALLDGGAMPGAGMGMNRMSSATARVLSVESHLGYGFGVLDGYGVLTPYGGFALTGEETRQYRLGGQLGLAQWLNLSLEGTRREAARQQPVNQGVQLKLEGRF